MYSVFVHSNWLSIFVLNIGVIIFNIRTENYYIDKQKSTPKFQK